MEISLCNVLVTDVKCMPKKVKLFEQAVIKLKQKKGVGQKGAWSLLGCYHGNNYLPCCVIIAPIWVCVLNLIIGTIIITCPITSQ